MNDTACETVTGGDVKVGKLAASLGGRLCTIPLSQIEVADRFREDYGNLNELALSLSTMGQLQNLVVCIQENEEFPYRLLAGGRRFKTMTEKLEWTEARALVFERELSVLEMLEVEWEENCRRKDLDWKEDCALKAQIQKLRIEQFGQRTGDMKSGTSIRQTAAELGVSPATMSEDVKLARAVEVVPQLFEGCRTKKEAKKVLKLATEQMMRAEKSAAIMQNVGQESKLQSLLDRYILNDFFAGIQNVPDKSVDFVEIDPPYAINLREVKRLKDTRYSLDSYNEVAVEDYLAFITACIKESYRIMNDNTFGILWHAPDPWHEHFKNILRDNGFETTGLTGKWTKPTGQCMQPSKYLANACEEFFYFWKGSPSIVRQGRTNVFQYVPVPAARKVHPTERPIELIQEILSTFCWEHSRICVPFLGSGKTILAAETLKMKAFGFELAASYKDAYTILAQEMFGGQ